MSELIKIKPRDKVVERVKEAINKLPKGWRSVVCFEYPEYDNEKGKQLLNNVAKGNTADLRVTEILEHLAQEYQAKAV